MTHLSFHPPLHGFGWRPLSAPASLLSGEDTSDRLASARGILVAMLLSGPIWLGVALLLC